MKGARVETMFLQKYWWKGTELLSVSQFLTVQSLISDEIFFITQSYFTAYSSEYMSNFNTMLFFFFTQRPSTLSISPFSYILPIFWIKVHGWYEELPNSFYCPVLSFKKNGTKSENYISWIHNHEKLFQKQKQIEICL